MPLVTSEGKGARRLRVCIAAMNFYPVYAGPAVRFTRYLPGFRARGLDILVFTGTPNRSKAAASGLDAHWQQHDSPGDALPLEAIHDVPIHRVRLSNDGHKRRTRQFRRALVDFCRHPGQVPDVVQLLWCNFSSIPALLRLRRLGLPIVYTATMLPDPPRNRIKRALLWRYRAWPLRLVNCIVVSSDTMRLTLRRLGVTSDVQVIPNGVDTRRFRPPDGPAERHRIRSELGIGQHETVLLYLGPIVARKGVDLLLRAWAQLAPKYPRLRLVLAGPRLDMNNPANEAFHAEVERLVTSSGASERVRFAGLVENVEDHMRAADIFLFASRREGMPNVFAEAMSSGLPIVTTPFIGLPSEFGQAGVHYVLADFDPASIVARVEELLDDPERRQSLATSARRWAEAHLGVDESLDRYTALYRELGTTVRHR